MSEAPSLPLDDNVFSVATLLKYMGNDEKALAIVTKIVRDACAPGMAPIEQARAAIDAGRLDVAGKIFHGLRGSVGSLGAKRLITASLALEQAMVDRATDHIPARFDDVQAQYALVLAHAAAWLDQHASDHGDASLS
ncbi:MAG: Hpt domain-containing protein [Duganella sp.]